MPKRALGPTLMTGTALPPTSPGEPRRIHGKPPHIDFFLLVVLGNVPHSAFYVRERLVLRDVALSFRLCM